MIWKKPEADEVPVQPLAQPLPPPLPPPKPQVQPAPKREQALIGPSIELKGTLSGGEDLVIEGRIEGKIELRNNSVIVGKSGHVKADVHGRTITVMGEIEGNLYGQEQISLRQASTVRGNLVAPRVILEDGCNFKGGIDMSSNGTGDKAKPLAG
ncbi:MAG: polymer-forming cytoskeletal protein [Acidobacteriia bacterium]|nr:polymer-forming cytoskeletal protein [Terriglobia bacterium]